MTKEYDVLKSRDQMRLFVQEKEALQKNASSQLENSNSEAQTKELEIYLNSLFYPNSRSKKAKSFTNKVIEAYENITGKALENFDWDAAILKLDQKNTNIENEYKIIRDQFDRDFEHTQRIKKDTIETRLETIKKALENIQSLKDIDEKIENLEKEIEKLMQNYQNFLENFGEKFDGKGWLKFNKDIDKDIIAQVQELDKQYESLSIVPIIPKDYGDIFEIALGIAAYAANQGIENVTEALLTKENLMGAKGPVTGSHKTSGESVISLEALLGDVKISKQKDMGKDINSTLTIGTPEQGGFTINTYIQKANASRPGKMDVIFTFGKITKKPFRITAKNWLTENDFGEVSLLNILRRTISSSQVMIQYMYSLGLSDQEAQGAKESAHDMAKFAIVLDTLMGYSQKNNWADTLVINLRAKKHVIVEHIPTLIKDVYNHKSSKISVVGYTTDKLENQAQSYYQNRIENLNYADYRSQMVDLMAQTRVTAQYKSQL